MHVFYTIFKKSMNSNAAAGLSELDATFDVPADNDAMYKDVANEADDEPERGSIEEAYGDMDVGNKIIVRDEANCRFYVFDTVAELYDMLVAPPLKCMHEVVLAGHSQKLRFDFDFNRAAFDELVRSASTPDGALMSDLLQAPEKIIQNPLLSSAIREDFESMLSTEGMRSGGYSQFMYSNQQTVIGDLMIRDFMRFLSGEINAYILRCDSYTVESSKFSVHLIVGAFTRNYEDMAEYAHHLYVKYRQQSSFAQLCARFMDMAVYKSIQNFRLCLSVKRGAGKDRQKVLRNKIVDDSYDNWRHTLLTHIDRYDVDLSEEVKRVVSITKARTVADMRGSTYFDINSAPDGFMEIISPYAEGFQPYAIYGNLVLFRRTHASFCQICGRGHEGDNSLMVIIMSRAYIIKCRRDMAGRKIVLPVKSRMVSRVQNPEQGQTEAIAGAPLVIVNRPSGSMTTAASSSPGKKQASLRKSRMDHLDSDLMY